MRSNILPRVILSVGMWYNIFNKKANDKMTVKERDIMPKGERKEYLNAQKEEGEPQWVMFLAENLKNTVKCEHRI